MKTHVYLTLKRCIEAIQKMKKERPDGIIHAVIYGDWGCGKTKAIQQVSKEFRIPAIKAERDLTISKLIRKITRAWGTEAGVHKDQNIDLLMALLSRRPIWERIMIIDEAQRIYRKMFLDELKDLAEDEECLLSFIFVADPTIKNYLTEVYHSLNKRILVISLERINKVTVEEILKRYQLEGNIEDLSKFAHENGLTTLDVDNACFFLAKAGIKEIDSITLKKAIEQIKRI